jgi:hypothetical protein
MNKSLADLASTEGDVVTDGNTVVNLI